MSPERASGDHAFMPRLLWAASWLLAAGALTGPILADDGHLAEIESWRLRRVESLTSETGWLTLTGLHRLDDGVHTLGSAPGAALALPPNAPAQAGTLTVTPGQVHFRAAATAAATVDSQPVEALTLATDAGGAPSLIEIGPINFYVIERGDVRLLRVRDRQHPARAAFEGIDYFPVDSQWRFDARFEVHEPLKQIPIANIIGLVSDSPSWGAVVFEHQGETFRIDAVAEPGAESLFLIFGDQTSGKETYGAGRYLYVDPPDADGRIDLDFNRAYNPPCAFTPFATCPLPPPQNRLALRIEAGERNYALEH